MRNTMNNEWLSSCMGKMNESKTTWIRLSLIVWYGILESFQLNDWGQWSTIDYKRKTTNEQRARSSKTWASVEEHDNARSTHTQGAHYCYLCFAYVCSSSALLEQLNEIETFQSRSLLSPYYRKVKNFTNMVECRSDLLRFHEKEETHLFQHALYLSK